MIKDDIYKIAERRDTILEVITDVAFEQFRDELKDLNGRELTDKDELEQLRIRKENVQLNIKKAVTARELFANMLPMTSFDDNMVPKLIERVDVVGKERIRVTLRGGLEVEGVVEKEVGQLNMILLPRQFRRRDDLLGNWRVFVFHVKLWKTLDFFEKIGYNRIGVV